MWNLCVNLMWLFQYTCIYNEWTINSSWTWYLYFRKPIERFRRLHGESLIICCMFFSTLMHPLEVITSFWYPNISWGKKLLDSHSPLFAKGGNLLYSHFPTYPGKGEIWLYSHFSGGNGSGGKMALSHRHNIWSST